MPSLVQGAKAHEQFAASWLEGLKPDLLSVDVKPADTASGAPATNRAPSQALTEPSPAIELQARQWMQTDDYDVVVYFPPDFSSRLNDFRAQLQADRKLPIGHVKASLEVPAPQIYFNSARDQSDVARSRVEQVIRRWQAAIGQQNLAENNIPQQALQPFAVPYTTTDTAEPGRAAVWSKILPMVLLLWALHRRVLSSHRFMRRREGTGHVGNAAVEPRRALRDRGRQAAHGHGIQHGHLDLESG